MWNEPASFEILVAMIDYGRGGPSFEEDSPASAWTCLEALQKWGCEHFGWGLQGLMLCHGLEQQAMHVMLLVPLYEGSPSRLSHEPSGRRHEYRGTVPVKSLAHSLGIQGPPCGLGGPWMPRMSCLGRLLSGSLRQEGIV